MAATNKGGRPKKDAKSPKLEYNPKDYKFYVKGTTPRFSTQVDPTQPGWAIASGGEIPFGKFIRAWNREDSLEDVHQKFWWKTPGQLTRKRGEINRFLVKEGFNPIKPLQTQAAQRKKWARELSKLVTDGEVARPEIALSDLF